LTTGGIRPLKNAHLSGEWQVTSDESRVTSSFFDLVTCHSSLVTDMGVLYLGIFEQPEDSEDAQKISYMFISKKAGILLTARHS